jgi:hypothetical protein
VSPLRHLCLLAAVAFAASPAQAQSFSGRYDLTGTDAALGAYAGTLEVRDLGTHYACIREARYQQPAGARPLTTVWIGTAVIQGNALHVVYPLHRMDWITAAGGLRRTAADQAPDPVSGTYRPDPSGGFAATLSSPAGSSATEVIVRRGAPGTSPLHVVERSRVGSHAAPQAWIKAILFRLFDSYHQLPDVAPYVARPDFQSAVHTEVRDRTGFAWLRAHPGERLLVNKRVDAISLAEAEVRRSAFGLRLHEKASSYDADAQGRHLDEGLIAFGVRDDPNNPGQLLKSADMSTFLWSACYLYGQASRFQVTQDPQARANVEAMIARFCDMIEIDPRPGEFARSLRPVNRAPNTGRWHAGSGAYSHLAWHDNGNNDMIKGFWLAFLAAWEVVPPSNTALRARMERCVREVVDHWAASNPSAAGGTGHKRDRPKSHLLNGMLAYWITGEARYQQLYRDQLRDPKLLLELAAGGNFAFIGISDWSGNHLGVTSLIAMIDLARKLQEPWLPLFEHALRVNHRRLRRYRQTVYSIAAAGLLGDASAQDEALWQLREFPYPKPRHEVDRGLDATWSLSPYPSHPWKRDWTTNAGRKTSLYHYPVFMRRSDNYVYRSNPFNRGGAANVHEHPGADYLFGYWIARRWGVIPASE